MTALRIALVHPYSWPEVRRGGERYLSDLAWYLRDAGHRVTVVTGGRERPDPTPPDVIWLRHRLPQALARRKVSVVDVFGVQAQHVLRKLHVDVVHALVPSAAVGARVAGKRVVYTVLGHPTRDQFGVRPFDWRLFRWATATARCTTVLSTASRDQVRELTGRDAVVLPPGVRREHFTSDLTPRIGQPRVLFSGDAADPRKGAQSLVAAFGRVLERHPDARLTLSGPAEHASLLNMWRVPGAVRSAIVDAGLGTPDELASLYRSAAVTVLPAQQEAFGLALVESLAAGTPVVACDEGGPRDIVTMPEIGRRVAFGDVDALAAAIDEVLVMSAQPQTPLRCVEHSKNWDWAASVGPRHEQLYRSLIDRGGTN